MAVEARVGGGVVGFLGVQKLTWSCVFLCGLGGAGGFVKLEWPEGTEGGGG